MAKQLACRECRCVTTAKVCPVCKSTYLSPDWNGIVLVVKPTNSKISNTLGITKPGKYALKVT